MRKGQTDTIPPARFIGSWNSLVERVRALSSEPRSPHDLGAEQLAFMSGMLGRAVDFRLAHPELEERWIDVNYYKPNADSFESLRISAALRRSTFRRTVGSGVTVRSPGDGGEETTEFSRPQMSKT